MFVILAFLTGVLCSYPNPIEDKCPGNYTNPLKVQTVIILGKVILWILHFLLERYIQYHHSKVRSRGYNMIDPQSTLYHTHNILSQKKSPSVWKQEAYIHCLFPNLLKLPALEKWPRVWQALNLLFPSLDLSQLFT